MSAGEQLRKAREKRGLTLEEVHEKTKIHVDVLKKIEQDQIQQLPSIIYAKSFIKEYTQFLGLDTESILKAFFESETGELRQELIIDEKRLPPFKPARIRSLIIGVSLAVAFLGIVLAVSLKSNKQAQSVGKNTPLAKKVAVVKRKVSASNKKPTVAKSGLNLTIEAKKDCFLRLEVDGKLLFSDILTAGSAEEWRAKEEFNLQISEGKSIELNLNGRQLGSPGAGFIKRLTITKKGITKK